MLSRPLEYFQKLSSLIQSVRVTDREGKSLTLDQGMDAALSMILNEGYKILLIGNGGSAAIVSHVQNDLCKAAGLRAMVFNEPPFLTALGNDHGYESVFERPVELWAESNDLLIAVSSSGKSESILRAVKTAKGKGCRVLTFSGFHEDNSLRSMGDVNFYVASGDYGFVEVSHMALAHFLTDQAMHQKIKNKEVAQS